MNLVHSFVVAAQQDVQIFSEDGELVASGSIEPFSFAEAFANGGFMMWPITFCALMALSLATRSVWKIRSDTGGIGTRTTIDGSLFWGGYAMGLGLLGTLVGVTITAQSVEAVGLVEPTLVWGGIKVSLVTTIFGMLICLTSGLVWYGLRHWHRRSVLSGD